MVPRSDLVVWLKSVRRLEPARITAEAEQLVADYVRRVKPIIAMLQEREHLSLVSAHLWTATAGHDTACGDELFRILSTEVRFEGAEVRHQLIGSIVAAYCWQSDPTLGHMDNPWPPLMDLLGLGYTLTFDDKDDESGTAIAVGFHDEVTLFAIE